MNEVVFEGKYSEFKSILDAEIKEAAAGFVRIGYLLKVARDTDILSESGYLSVAEFAKAEYGLTKDIVSRYIAINDRYSEGGYSDMLQMKFAGYGVAKLAEMLTLPEEIAEQLPSDMTRREMQAIKKEYAEEKEISDLEVMMETPGPILRNNLEKALYEYFRVKEQFRVLYEEQLTYYGWRKDEVLEVLAPQGIANIRVRIPAVGRVMLVIDEEQESIVLTNMRTLEKEIYSWQDAGTALEALKMECMPMEEAYFVLYKEEMEQKEEVVPVQQVPEAVNVAKMVEKTECEEAPEEDVQIPGQMNVEDYPELMPEEVKKDDVSDNMSGSIGTDGADGEPEEDNGTDFVSEYNEVSGAPEDAGCEADNGEGESDFWREADTLMNKIREFMKLRNWGETIETEIVKKMYNDSVSLAAVFEQILKERANNEE